MLPLVKPYLPSKEELMPEIEKTLYSGYIAEGEKVYEFEKEFSNFIGNQFSLSVNSGTAALHLALLLASVGPGNEVISTVLTAEPTNVAIALTGAKVVWADIDPATGLIDPESVKEKITPKTKAIMVVHYAGMVADLDSLGAISKEFNIPIVEDAAHALGATYANAPIGSISDFTVFSLQAIKHITTVDGGILAVKNIEKYNAGKLLRWFGLDKSKPRLENDIKVAGYKYHMNNVNATIGLVQMRHVKNVVGKYIENGIYFDEALKGVTGLTLLNYYPQARGAYWLYTMKVDKREEFIKMMISNGIAASELHLRNDRHSIFNASKASLPNFEAFYKKMVHIPCGWWITEENREKIASVIKSGW